MTTGLKRAVAIKEFFPQVQGCSRYGTTVQPGGMITHVDYLHEKNKFLAEGQRLAQFQHPSIVKVFSLFEENNTAYMVMEFLRGKTLLKIIEEDGRLEEKDCRRIHRANRGGIRCYPWVETAPSGHQAREYYHHRRRTRCSRGLWDGPRVRGWKNPTNDDHPHAWLRPT